MKSLRFIRKTRKSAPIGIWFISFCMFCMLVSLRLQAEESLEYFTHPSLSCGAQTGAIFCRGVLRRHGHFVIYYNKNLASDAFSTQILDSLEYAYTQYISNWGFLWPHSEKINVFLNPSNNNGKLGLWTNDNKNPPRINIYIITLASTGKPLADIKIYDPTIFHELFHAIQNPFCNEAPCHWLGEATAEAMSDAILNTEEMRRKKGLPSYIAQPDYASNGKVEWIFGGTQKDFAQTWKKYGLVAITQAPENHQYTSSLFFSYLIQQFGIDIIKTLWNHFSTNRDIFDTFYNTLGSRENYSEILHHFAQVLLVGSHGELPGKFDHDSIDFLPIFSTSNPVSKTINLGTDGYIGNLDKVNGQIIPKKILIDDDNHHTQSSYKYIVIKPIIQSSPNIKKPLYIAILNISPGVTCSAAVIENNKASFIYPKDNLITINDYSTDKKLALVVTKLYRQEQPLEIIGAWGKPPHLKTFALSYPTSTGSKSIYEASWYDVNGQALRELEKRKDEEVTIPMELFPYEHKSISINLESYFEIERDAPLKNLEIEIKGISYPLSSCQMVPISNKVDSYTCFLKNIEIKKADEALANTIPIKFRAQDIYGNNLDSDPQTPVHLGLHGWENYSIGDSSPGDTTHQFKLEAYFSDCKALPLSEQEKCRQEEPVTSNSPSDNCPGVDNPLQKDADNDGIGDACDPCTEAGNRNLYSISVSPICVSNGYSIVCAPSGNVSLTVNGHVQTKPFSYGAEGTQASALFAIDPAHLNYGDNNTFSASWEGWDGDKKSSLFGFVAVHYELEGKQQKNKTGTFLNYTGTGSATYYIPKCVNADSPQ